MTLEEIPRENIRAVATYCLCGTHILVVSHAKDPHQLTVRSRTIYVQCTKDTCKRFVELTVQVA